MRALPVLGGFDVAEVRAPSFGLAAVLAQYEEDDRMTTRLSVFNSPLLLGFDHFERVLDRISKTSAEGYPPYNIEQLGEDGLRITLAVAGFSMQDLNVAIEDNQLIIRGRQNEEDGDRIFLHRGIAARQFQRSFVLAEGIEVKGAWLDNGLLHVDLVRPLPATRVRTIEIQGNPNAAASPRTFDLDSSKTLSAGLPEGGKK